MGASTSRQLHSRCPLCGGEDLKPRWQVGDYLICQCQKCSLVFVANQVTTEDLIAHYATFTDDSYSDANLECLNYYYYRLGDLIRKRFPKPGKLLDVGCSRGWFLDTMPDWERHGIEIAVDYGTTAREKYGDRIFLGPFDQYPMREGYFDVITLQDVFDHIPDPLPMLQKCNRLLKPKGMIAVKVHNISCLFARLSGSKFYAVIPPSHLFYYDKRTLALTLEGVGFQVTDSLFIGHLFKMKTIFLRLSNGDPTHPLFRIYESLDGTAFGEMKFKKNLHDIITMLAIKQA